MKPLTEREVIVLARQCGMRVCSTEEHHDCLFGRDGLNGDTDAEKEPESMDAAVDWMGRRLNELVELAAAGTIRSTTIQTVDHGKASISVSAKGTIKVARIEARACQLEA